MAAEVEYQIASQVRQLLAERENAVGYGQETRIEAIDKQLKELGVTPKQVKKLEAETVEEPAKAPPVERSTKQEHQQKT